MSSSGPAQSPSTKTIVIASPRTTKSPRQQSPNRRRTTTRHQRTLQGTEPDKDIHEESSVNSNDPDDDDDDEQEESYEFDGVKFSTYQEMVNAKRQRNQQMLAQSGLLDIALSSNRQEKPGITAKNKKKKRTQPQRTSSRKSKRLSGEQADGMYIEDERGGRFSFGSTSGTVEPHKESEGNTKPEKEEDDFYGHRINDGSDLTVAQAVNNIGPKWLDDDEDDVAKTILQAQQFFQTIQRPTTSKIQNTKDETSPKSVVSSLVPTASNKTISNSALLGPQLDRMSVGGATDLESHAATNATVKMVPDRVYSIATHPSSDRILVCAGDKQGYLGIWDATSRERRFVDPTTSSSDSILAESKQDVSDAQATSEDESTLHLFRFHTRPVTSIAWTGGGNSMLTTSYDSTCRMWNVERQSFAQVFAAYDDDSQHAHHAGHGLDTGGRDFWFQSSCIDHRCSQDDVAMFVTTSIGTVMHVDLRARTCLNWNEQLSEKKINTVR